MKTKKKKTTKKKAKKKVTVSDSISKLDKDNLKMRVSIYLDVDIVRELKRRAEETNGRYQTILNQTLRDAVLGKSKIKIDEIEDLEDFVEKLVERKLKKLA